MTSAAAVMALGATMSATAGTAVIDGLGGPLIVHSKEIANVFGSGSPEWTNAALNLVHSDIHDSGIVTDGFVTLLLADTDHGLTWMALVDDKTQPPGGDVIRTQLGMSSTAPDTGVQFVNDLGEDIDHFFDPPNGTQTAAGHFTWNADGGGDAFAWASLNVGDFVSFNFDRGGPRFDSFPGLNEENTFQFLSWNGESWEIVAQREFSVNDQFAFSFTIIPLPAPVALGLVGLGIVAAVRRRAIRA